MSAKPRPRGLALPGAGQFLVLAAAITGACLLWSEVRGRRLISGLDPAQQSTTAQLQTFDALVSEGSEAIPELLAMLSDADPKTRRHAVLSLGRIGLGGADKDGGDAIGHVRARLSDEDAGVRSYAFVAFGLVCQSQEELIAVSARMLADSNADVRDQARQMLADSGQSAVPTVIELLDSGSPQVKSLAVGILVSINRYRTRLQVAEQVRPLLFDADQSVRVHAIQALVEWGTARPDEARAWLCDGDPQIVNSGLAAMDWYDSDSAQALPDLIRLLADAEGERLRQLLRPLRALGTVARPAIPLLVRRLESIDELSTGVSFRIPARAEIVETLAEIGVNPDVLARLLAPDVDNATWAREILALKLPHEARRHAALLIPQLKSSDRSSCERALRGLRGFGTQAQAAAPALIPLIGRSDEHLTRLAVALLVEVDPRGAAPAVPWLLAELERDRRDPSDSFHAALDALGKIGPAARDAVPALFAILDAPPVDSSQIMGRAGFDWWRLGVILALGRIGVDDPAVLAVLRGLLTGKSWQDRAAAAEALSFPGMAGAAVLADLVGALDDEDAYVRTSAALAVGALSVDRSRAVDPLIDALNDRDSFVQTAAAIALGQIGLAAAPAVEALRAASRDPRHMYSNATRHGSMPWRLRADRFLRQRSVAHAARAALSKIESDAPQR